MIKFHAVMLDETGCEFGADVEAPDRDTAYDELKDRYPESSVVQLESPEDTAARERAIYARISEDDYDYEEDL